MRLLFGLMEAAWAMAGVAGDGTKALGFWLLGAGLASVVEGEFGRLQEMGHKRQANSRKTAKSGNGKPTDLMMAGEQQANSRTKAA